MVILKWYVFCSAVEFVCYESNYNLIVFLKSHSYIHSQSYDSLTCIFLSSEAQAIRSGATRFARCSQRA